MPGEPLEGDAVLAQPLRLEGGQGRGVGLRGKYAGEAKIHVFDSELACYVNIYLEYVRVHVSYWTNQADYAIRIPVAAPQEYVNTHSPRRGVGHA